LATKHIGPKHICPVHRSSQNLKVSSGLRARAPTTAHPTSPSLFNSPCHKCSQIIIAANG
jgi:hypothetical protein